MLWLDQNKHGRAHRASPQPTHRQVLDLPLESNFLNFCVVLSWSSESSENSISTMSLVMTPSCQTISTHTHTLRNYTSQRSKLTGWLATKSETYGPKRLKPFFLHISHVTFEALCYDMMAVVVMVVVVVFWDSLWQGSWGRSPPEDSQTWPPLRWACQRFSSWRATSQKGDRSVHTPHTRHTCAYAGTLCV